MNLTREQIEAMPAGREMDALIATEVMGWAPSCNIADGPKGVPLDCWHRWTEDDREFHRKTGIKPLGGGSDCVEYQSTDILEHGGFAPSRDIADTWKALDELRRRFCCVKLDFDYHYRSAITIRLDPEHEAEITYEMDGGQEALLICLGALIALDSSRPPIVDPGANTEATKPSSKP